MSVVLEFLIIRKRMRSQWVKYKEHTLVGELDKALKHSNKRWGMPLMGQSFKTQRGRLEEGSGNTEVRIRAISISLTGGSLIRFP